MKKFSLLTIITTSILSSSAFALTQEVELNLFGTHLRGQDSLPIRNLINRRLGPKTARGWAVTEIVVDAKSKNGEGELALQVGHQYSHYLQVPGTPEIFHEPLLGYTKIKLYSPTTYRGEAPKRTKLISMGNIKIKHAHIKLHKTVNYDSQNLNMAGLTQKVEFKAKKVIGSNRVIKPLGRVRGIVLTGTKRKVNIDKVEIKFFDGQTIQINELNGKLRQGREKIFALRGILAKPINTITVSASTTSLFGSSGRLAVSLAQ